MVLPPYGASLASSPRRVSARLATFSFCGPAFAQLPASALSGNWCLQWRADVPAWLDSGFADLVSRGSGLLSFSLGCRGFEGQNP